jgi:osmoprotectant transport system ATP-binding protein
MIELRGVSKRFGEQVALHPTDLSFPAGQTTALIGPSGCGKSTILRLIIGLLSPSTGEVVFDNRTVDVASLADVRRQVGYVIQDGGLFPHLTAGQNVALMARHIGRPEGEVTKRLDELCELTRFPKDGLNRYPTELSGGQRQRIALMRGLMLEPSALLLDEPLGALDPMVRAALQTDLKAIFGRLKQTVVFVTHDMGEAGYLADRIVLMREGRVVQQGVLEDFKQRPAEPYVEEFLNAQRSLVQL